VATGHRASTPVLALELRSLQAIGLALFSFCSYFEAASYKGGAAMQFSLPLNDRDVVREIRDRLLARLGKQRDTMRRDPVSQLVNGIISAKTRDEVSSAAFARLQHRYVSWDALRFATPGEVEAIIAPVHHADSKAVHLPQALRKIVAATGSLDLDFLIDWDEEMAMQWLRGLAGVGSKVAATVLNFSTLRMRVLPVDTHLLRVGERLGLLPIATDYESGYELFMRIVPDEWDADDLYEFHWLLKYLGQIVCRYGTPRCARCPLSDLCPSCALVRNKP
jgi:endonuclease III